RRPAPGPPPTLGPPPADPTHHRTSRSPAVVQVALLLDEGAEFIPGDHDVYATIQMETSRLRNAAERLRKAASDAQQASEQ
ncbi:hypothetical protein ABTX79_36995, partial [Streptomyces sp. NPDC096153]